MNKTAPIGSALNPTGANPRPTKGGGWSVQDPVTKQWVQRTGRNDMAYVYRRGE